MENYQFTQKERDRESGFDYFEARYYSSVQSRFSSVDPASQCNLLSEIQIPQSLNIYAYAKNNPIVYNDKDGRIANFIVGAVLGAGVEIAEQVITAKLQGKEVQLDVPSIVAAAAVGAATSGISAIEGVGAKLALGAVAKMDQEFVARGVSAVASAVYDNPIMHHENKNIGVQALLGVAGAFGGKVVGEKLEHATVEVMSSKSLLAGVNPVLASQITKRGLESVVKSSGIGGVANGVGERLTDSSISVSKELAFPEDQSSEKGTVEK